MFFFYVLYVHRKKNILYHFVHFVFLWQYQVHVQEYTKDLLN